MLTFFNDNFGRYLTHQTGDAAEDAQRALSSGHLMKKGGPRQRIATGWAIVRPGTSTMRFELTALGISYSKQTRFEAFQAELDHWDGSPRMFIEFDKKQIPLSKLFITYDLRVVRICSAKGTETFDYTTPPEKDGTKTHKILWKQKAGKT